MKRSKGHEIKTGKSPIKYGHKHQILKFEGVCILHLVSNIHLKTRQRFERTHREQCSTRGLLS